MSGVMSCHKCETTWLSSYSSRCLCGAEGVEGKLPDAKVAPAETSAVTHYAALPDADDPDYWSLW